MRPARNAAKSIAESVGRAVVRNAAEKRRSPPLPGVEAFRAWFMLPLNKPAKASNSESEKTENRNHKAAR
jgi:hypothetical protein